MSNSLKIFATLIILLAIAALAIGDKTLSSGDKRQLNSEQLSLTFAEYDEVIQAPVNRITPVALADYLIKQEEHYYLIDLQGSEASYHIPTAEVDTMANFLARNLRVNEDIILYSQNETQALQLYYLLLIRGYFKVKILQGGVEGWFSQVLQPDVSNMSEAEQSERNRITQFFGGSLQRDAQSFKPDAVQLIKKHKIHQGC